MTITSGGTWSEPPRMDDLAEMARVGAVHPMETTLRLEALRRELGHAVEADPRRVGNLALSLEHHRSQLDRQLRHALGMLADRATAVETLAARVEFLEGRLAQVEQRQQLRRSIWSWLS